MTKSIQLSDGITLLSGAMMDYNHPENSAASILDIATGLSNICRFSGQLPTFYSVAQHAVNVSYLLEGTGFEFDGLMHDTAEAFTGDLPTPLKAAIPQFKTLERRIEEVMAHRFGYDLGVAPVKHADLVMLAAEKRFVKNDTSHWVCLEEVEKELDYDWLWANLEWNQLSPSEARELFLVRYDEVKP